MATGSSTLVKVDSDGGLVLATLAGDHAAFTALYDRFATRVYDLHLALVRDPYQALLATHHTFRDAIADLNHLGEPSALRPWLYTHAYRQARQRITAIAKGKPGPNPRWAAGIRFGPDPQASMWQRLPENLSSKDAALLTLRLRHGLSLEEAGSVVGLSAKGAHARLAKLDPAVWQGLGPLIGRLGPAESDPLGALASLPDAAPGYTTEEDPAPPRLTVPFALPPGELRRELLGGTPLISAHEGLPRPRTRTAWSITATVVLILIVGTVLLVHRSMERRPVIAVRFGPAAEFALSTTMIDLGASASNATLTLSNTGNNMLAWSADPADPWLKVEPASGSLAGGQSQQLTVTADRNTLPEGDGRTELRFSSAHDQGRGDVAVALREERPPAIVKPRASNTRIGGYKCPTTTEIRATITDESPPIHVVLVGAGGQTQVMKAAGSIYTGRLGSGSHASFSWRIIATDSRNNTATSPAQTVVHADCAVRPAPRPKPVTPPQQQESTPNQPGEPGDDASGTGSTGDTPGDTGAGDSGAGDNGSGDAGSGDSGSGDGDSGDGGASDNGSGDSGADDGGDSGSNPDGG